MFVAEAEKGIGKWHRFGTRRQEGPMRRTPCESFVGDRAVQSVSNNPTMLAIVRAWLAVQRIPARIVPANKSFGIFPEWHPV